jgi:hypothetical protein
LLSKNLTRFVQRAHRFVLQSNESAKRKQQFKKIPNIEKRQNYWTHCNEGIISISTAVRNPRVPYDQGIA